MLLGSLTGRDGIGGVSVLASAGFGRRYRGRSKPSDPTSRWAIPSKRKRLIEACLQLLDEAPGGGHPDLGGAGLACATSETASRGGVGMDVNVTAVPRHEPGMEPVGGHDEREPRRMLAIVSPEALDARPGVAVRWEVRATVVGQGHGHRAALRILDGWDGGVLADVPAATLHGDAPSRITGPWRRPRSRPSPRQRSCPDGGPRRDCGAEFAVVLVDPSWVYRQYDHQLFLNTVVAPGAEAALCAPRRTWRAPEPQAATR